MTASSLSLRNVHKSFKRKLVLDGVDLDIPAGSVVGLLGRNGAGKTTLIKLALGLLRCDGGEARVFGADSWDLPPQVKARIGYVAQTPCLYPWMRVKQVIAYTAAFYENWNDDLAADLVARWELEANDRVGQMSVGQQQRLANVLALAHEPDLLVLDEPAASLDPSGRRQFLRAILDAAVDGTRSVLFSTHITSDLERVADHVALLGEGKVQWFGELEALKDDIKRLHIIAAQDLPATLRIEGALHEQVTGREAQVTVRGLTGDDVEALEQRLGATISVEHLNLEDIFLELADEQQQAVH